MVKIKTSEELIQTHDHLAACLDKKFHCEEGKRAIVVCGGTGCLSSDSADLLKRLQELIKEKGLEDVARVARSIVGELKQSTIKYVEEKIGVGLTVEGE